MELQSSGWSCRKKKGTKENSIAVLAVYLWSDGKWISLANNYDKWIMKTNQKIESKRRLVARWKKIDKLLEPKIFWNSEFFMLSSYQTV